MGQSRPFKVSFPGLTLPSQYGGKRAIVIRSMQHPQNPAMAALCDCVDIDGGIHQNVPLMIGEVMKAMQTSPVYFQEVEQNLAPTAGLIIPST